MVCDVILRLKPLFFPITGNFCYEVRFTTVFISVVLNEEHS